MSRSSGNGSTEAVAKTVWRVRLRGRMRRNVTGFDIRGVNEMAGSATREEWSEVIDFWFPEGLSLDVDARTHRDNWIWRMRGGADEEIFARFSRLARRAAAGALDHWAADAHGRLALIVVLDQFSRAVWKGTARAYAQDAAALSLAMQGYANGHYAALETPWFKTVYNLPLGHCEGAEHLERLDRAVWLAREIAAEAPEHLRQEYDFAMGQAARVRKVIETFGRHPHRNACLGRLSTPAEVLYIADGDFPHLRMPMDASTRAGTL